MNAKPADTFEVLKHLQKCIRFAERTIRECQRTQDFRERRELAWVVTLLTKITQSASAIRRLLITQHSYDAFSILRTICDATLDMGFVLSAPNNAAKLRYYLTLEGKEDDALEFELCALLLKKSPSQLAKEHPNLKPFLEGGKAVKAHPAWKNAREHRKKTGEKRLRDIHWEEKQKECCKALAACGYDGNTVNNFQKMCKYVMGYGHAFIHSRPLALNRYATVAKNGSVSFNYRPEEQARMYIPLVASFTWLALVFSTELCIHHCQLSQALRRRAMAIFNSFDDIMHNIQ